MIKREKWLNRYVWVARDNGKIISWKNVKGSRLNKSTASTIFNENKTFNKNIKRESIKLTNLRETFISKTTRVTSKRNDLKHSLTYHIGKKKSLQYTVTGIYKGKVIAARSQNIMSSRSLYHTKREAKENAWISFWERISQANGGNYDDDDGFDLRDKVKNIREGWVYYD